MKNKNEEKWNDIKGKTRRKWATMIAEDSNYPRHSATLANRAAKLPPKIDAKNDAILSTIYRCSPIIAQNRPILALTACQLSRPIHFLKMTIFRQKPFKNWTYKGELISLIYKSILAVLCTAPFSQKCRFLHFCAKICTFKVNLESF